MLANRIKNLFLSSVLLTSGLGVAGMATAVEVGEKAPDFKLPSTVGKDISLSQFQGKKHILMEFYEADFSPVCAENLSARKADYSKFQELDVQVLGITNTLPFSQKAFADSLKLPYPLLSDPFLQTTKAYGVLHGSTTCVASTPGCENQKIDAPGMEWGSLSNMEGRISKLSFFFVDKGGIIRGKWIGEDSTVFSTEELLKAAREITGKP